MEGDASTAVTLWRAGRRLRQGASAPRCVGLATVLAVPGEHVAIFLYVDAAAAGRHDDRFGFAASRSATRHRSARACRRARLVIQVKRTAPQQPAPGTSMSETPNRSSTRAAAALIEGAGKAVRSRPARASCAHGVARAMALGGRRARLFSDQLVPRRTAVPNRRRRGTPNARPGAGRSHGARGARLDHRAPDIDQARSARPGGQVVLARAAGKAAVEV